MAHNETEIGTLLKEGREQEAADKLVELLNVHNGNVVHTALAVSAHRSTVKRWIARLEAGGWEVRKHVQQMRSVATPGHCLSAAQRAEAEEQVRVRREVSRALVWLEKASKSELKSVRMELGLHGGCVDDLIAGLHVTPSVIDRILAVVRRRMEARRKEWRNRRRVTEG